MMITSQTRDGKSYACCLSRKVYVRANGNRHWRDAIKHPARVVRSCSLLGGILENLWSLLGRHGGILLKSKHSDSLCECVFWSSSRTRFLLVGLALQWQHKALWKRQKESLGYFMLWFKMCRMTWAVSACCDESSNVTYPMLGNVISGQLSLFGSAAPAVSS